jgi:polyisoprenyl-phosphate glycosyltransferase
MTGSALNQRANFLSIVLLAGEDSDEEVSIAHSELSLIARNRSKHFEIVIMRSPRRGSNLASSQLLQASLSNAVFIEQSARVSRNSSAVTGLRQAIGDWVLVLESSPDQRAAAEKLISEIADGYHAIFGKSFSEKRKTQRLSYRLGQKVFGLAFSAIHGSNISLEAPVFRVMSRPAVNLILSARRPEVEFRAFILTGSLPVKSVTYKLNSQERSTGFWESYSSAMQMLLGGTKVPMRFASLISIAGALLNVIYAVYVLVVSLVRDDVQDGWASTSLQLSSMFFLVCLVLFFISEYLLQLMPDREHTSIHFSTQFDGDTVQVEKNLNVEKLQKGQT